MKGSEVDQLIVGEEFSLGKCFPLEDVRITPLLLLHLGLIII